MSIIYDSNEKVFYLNTPNTSYVMNVYCDKYLLHLYYGKKVDKFPGIKENLPTAEGKPLYPNDIKETNGCSSILSMEYPCYGSADFRTPAFHAEYENGSAITKLEYAGYETIKEKATFMTLTYVIFLTVND